MNYQDLWHLYFYWCEDASFKGKTATSISWLCSTVIGVCLDGWIKARLKLSESAEHLTGLFFFQHISRFRCCLNLLMPPLKSWLVKVVQIRLISVPVRKKICCTCELPRDLQIFPFVYLGISLTGNGRYHLKLVEFWGDSKYGWPQRLSFSKGLKEKQADPCEKIIWGRARLSCEKSQRRKWIWCYLLVWMESRLRVDLRH